MHTRYRKTGGKEKSLCDSSRTDVDKHWIHPLIVNHKISISLIIRFSSLISCCTYYVPDEYWQSTEVAHQNVYGYGYLTWEWKEMIRSYLHPFVFEIYFQCVKLIHLDHADILIYGPHVLQASLSVLADRAVYVLTFNVFKNRDIAILALLLHWLSWFVFYTGSRTLSNTSEMCFLVVGLSFFSFSDDGNGKILNNDNLFYGILFGGIGCIIRSTSLIIWCPFVFILLLSKEISLLDLLISTLKALPILLLLSFGVDYYFYKQFVFVHYNFLKFNLFKNISGFYGLHSFHWYFTQGIPVVFSFHMIFVVSGIYYSKKLTLSWVAMFYIIVHSFIPHKEFRFLLPICPIFACYAGYGIYQVNKWYKELSRKMFLLIVLTNVTLAAYFSLVHQRGTVSVLSYLRNKDLEKFNDSVLFLMPCHSTPFYSHLHKDVELIFLTCHPNQQVGYVDEADKFYNNPVQWLDSKYVNKSHNPSYIVIFNVLANEIKGKLAGMDYVKETSFFHSHFPEGRIGGYVDVYKKDYKNN